MSEIYSFEFSGTKEDFHEKLLQLSHTNDIFFYFQDFIVEIHDNNYRFGIMRAGHSAGYWYEPTITELDGKIIFSGQIHLRGYGASEKEQKKDKIEKYALIVLLFPIFLLLGMVYLIGKCIKRFRKKPVEYRENEEKRLFHLMEDQLGCRRKPD